MVVVGVGETVRLLLLWLLLLVVFVLMGGTDRHGTISTTSTPTFTHYNSPPLRGICLNTIAVVVVIVVAVVVVVVVVAVDAIAL